MSFDLGVWYPSKKLSNTEAGELYLQLCLGKDGNNLTHEAINNFYLELTSLHPEIDNIPEDQIDNTDLCPWSIAFDRSPSHLIMSCVWSKSEYVENLILNLAQKHFLAVYNPQTNQYILPMKKEKPWWKFK